MFPTNQDLATFWGRLHVHENPHEPPSLCLVLLSGIGPVSLEIDVINQGVSSVCGRGDLVIAILDMGPLSDRGGGHDPRQSRARLFHDEIGLQLYRSLQPSAKSGEGGSIEITLKFAPT